LAKLPLISSRQLTNAFQRLGFEPARSASGSHQFWVKELPDGSKIGVPLLLGKKEIKPSTLKKVLDTAQISDADFLKSLK